MLKSEYKTKFAVVVHVVRARSSITGNTDLPID